MSGVYSMTSTACCRKYTHDTNSEEGSPGYSQSRRKSRQPPWRPMQLGQNVPLAFNRATTSKHARRMEGHRGRKPCPKGRVCRPSNTFCLVSNMQWVNNAWGSITQLSHVGPVERTPGPGPCTIRAREGPCLDFRSGSVQGSPPLGAVPAPAPAPPPKVAEPPGSDSSTTSPVFSWLTHAIQTHQAARRGGAERGGRGRARMCVPGVNSTAQELRRGPTSQRAGTRAATPPYILNHKHLRGRSLRCAVPHHLLAGSLQGARGSGHVFGKK